MEQQKAVRAALSLLAPGAGQAAAGRFVSAALFGAAAFFWAAAGWAIVSVFLLKALAASGMTSLLPAAPLLVPAGFAVVALASALEAALRGAAARPPGPRAGAAWLACLWLAIAFGAPAAGRAVMPLALGLASGGGAGEALKHYGEISAALDSARAGSEAADRLAEEISALPKGPFAGETRGGRFYTREEDSFPVPGNYIAEPGPSEDEPEGQQVMLYPGPMQREFTARTATMGDLLRRGLVILEISPVEPGSREGYAEEFTGMLEKQAAANPAWKASVERKTDLPLKAALFRMGDPKLVRLYLFGRERLFCFKAYEEGPLLYGMAAGFREAGK